MVVPKRLKEQTNIKLERSSAILSNFNFCNVSNSFLIQTDRFFNSCYMYVMQIHKNSGHNFLLEWVKITP